MSNRLMVLKFGSSVLRQTQDVHRVVQEIYRWRRAGYCVLAVVSAIGDTTNQLAEQASQFGDDIDSQKTASLLATGELQSAALTGLALDRAGVSSFTCDDASIELRTEGSLLDARLVDVDRDRLRSLLDERGVVVLPGFIGRNAAGEQTLLGRGGSDLTALFLASNLQADLCRLIKDVDGLYEYDPRRADKIAPRRYDRLTWEDALQLDESIVQHKAIRFARESGLTFQVSSLAQRSGTSVGPFTSSRFTATSCRHMRIQREGKLRVAILGLGTVGFGVYRQITELFTDHFTVVAVAVNDWRKAIRNGVPVELIAADAEAAVASDCDVIIELVGGVVEPSQWISQALTQRKHVVTANKALLAERADDLESMARQYGVRLLWSAAVGGSLPALETVAEWSTTCDVEQIEGILNGATNFVLEQVTSGMSFERAVTVAAERGLTERDPGFDLAGIDAAQKLVLLARACGRQLDQADIVRQEVTASLAESFNRESNNQLRQIARLRLRGEEASAEVVIQAVSSESRFAGISGSGNVLFLKTKSGASTTVSGRGAGRWPTTASVIGDLLELTRDCDARTFAEFGTSTSVAGS